MTLIEDKLDEIVRFAEEAIRHSCDKAIYLRYDRMFMLWNERIGPRLVVVFHKEGAATNYDSWDNAAEVHYDFDGSTVLGDLLHSIYLGHLEKFYGDDT
ncbi:hypothetical protein SEA_JONJAMES_11 [Gordonia Phage JonJames]|nr:hypothetical protein SEA_JONJAMES_11 [Gordonia Phage JonJames]